MGWSYKYYEYMFGVLLGSRYWFFQESDNPHILFNIIDIYIFL